jgi:hypothetical protein
MSGMTGKVLVAVLGITVLTGCFERENLVAPTNFENLKSRDDTIVNVDQAYREKSLEEFGRLFDSDFAFCFTAESGTSCWDRSAALAATGVLFSPSLLIESEPVEGVEFGFAYEAGANKWVSSTPPDPRRYPDETLWEKVVDYTIRVSKNGETSIWGEGRATWIVRVGELDGGKRWRIFGIADHGGHWGRLLEQAEAAD